MRIFDNETLNKARRLALQPGDVFVSELWYSLTHQQSLDSYRVRCMNARTLVRELVEELRIGRLDQEEYKGLCEETLQACRWDPVVATAFPAAYAQAEPLLASPPDAPWFRAEKRAASTDPVPFRKLLFAVEDLDACLRGGYIRKLCERFPEAVSSGDQSAIARALGPLLAELLALGWPLESLFRWHQIYLREVGADRTKYTFRENLGFALNVFQKPPSDFEVILRIQGSTKLASIGRHGQFGFSRTGLDAPAAYEPRPPPGASDFTGARTGVTFATIAVRGLDQLSAAIEARSRFEDLADVLCFDFERNRLQVDPRTYVKRLGDGRVFVERVIHAIPNPRRDPTGDEFREFAAVLEEIGKSQTQESESRRLLQGAIRQYRFGQSSESYRDKFMNWWTGLESLAYVGAGDIGARVIQNISAVMCLAYLRRLLTDLASTLQFCGIDWTPEMQAASGAAGLADIGAGQLLTLLQNSSAADALWTACAGHPVLIYRGKKLQERLTDAAKTAEAVEQHRLNLRWHLARLYRVRCCIVHGAEVRLRLPLLTANLEFYLKESIEATLDAFHRHHHVRSLPDLYHRADLTNDRVLASLKKGGAGLPEIRDAVLAWVTTQEGDEP